MPHRSDLRRQTVDQRRQVLLHRWGALEAELEALGHQPQEHHRLRIGVEKPQTIQQIGHPDLVHRQAVPNGRGDVFAVEADQGARWLVGAHGVDQDDVPSLGQVTEQRKTQGAAVEGFDLGRQHVLPGETDDGLHTEAVVTTQDVAEAQHQQRLRRGGRGVGTAQRVSSEALRRRILKPEKIESIVPFFSTTAINQAL